MVADTILVLLLATLVAGLLRSHADIVRKLHELGAPVGDPASRRRDAAVAFHKAGDGVVQMGAPIPPRSGGSTVFDIEGRTPGGDGLALALRGTGCRTLLAFLSSGCSTCGRIWEELAGAAVSLPGGVRTVVVTKGPDAEQVAALERLAAGSGDVPVVMSSAAWSDYEVPGSPFFVLVDGAADRRVGEGTARSLSDVAQLVPSTTTDRDHVPTTTSDGPGQGPSTTTDRDHVPTVDAELLAAGIVPGHESLFPSTVDDLVRREARPVSREARPVPREARPVSPEPTGQER